MLIFCRPVLWQSRLHNDEAWILLIPAFSLMKDFSIGFPDFARNPFYWSAFYFLSSGNKCSIAYKSGNCAGQSKRLTFLTAKNCFTTSDVYLLSLSCWNIDPCGICINWPISLRENGPQAIVLPLPYFTVGIWYLKLNRDLSAKNFSLSKTKL